MAAFPATSARTARPAAATSGSQTVTQTGTPEPFVSSGTLRLRAEPAEGRHIQWAEDVIDNEGMGKKSSKVCCIYHKAREVGESSDESSSDDSSSSDDDSDVDNGEARPAGRAGRGGHPHRHHKHEHNHGEGECVPGGGDGGKGKAKRKPSPNAYEKMPKNTAKKTGGSS